MSLLLHRVLKASIVLIADLLIYSKPFLLNLLKSSLALGMDKKHEIENECISNQNIVSKVHCHSFDPFFSEIFLPNLVKDHTHAPYEVVSQKAFRQKFHGPDEASCSGLNQQRQNLNNSERSICSYRGSHKQDLVTSCGTAVSGYVASYPLVQSKQDFLVGYFPSSSCSMTAVAEDGEQSKDVARGGKQRIRWTPELHEQFVAAVNSLGGPMKATPRGILSLMKSQGLTIFHIKSHLQKYRNSKHLPNLQEGKGGGQANPDGEYIPNLKGAGGLHISEALQLQMDVQKTLHEHLEFQKRLQLRIEEQANYLQWLFDQQKICSNLNENQNLNKQMDTSPPECSSAGGYSMYSRVQHR